MIRSLRWRLQIWYTALLLVVVVGFGSILYFQTRTAKLQEIDGQLEAAALYLDATLKSFPQFEFGGKDPPPPREPKDKKGPKGFDWDGPKDKKGPKGPPPRNREKMLADLAVPREFEPAGVPEADRPYFGVWREDGGIVKATALPDGLMPRSDDDSLPTRPRAEERGNYREVWMRGPSKTRILVGRTVAKEWADLHAFAWQLAGIGAAVLAVGVVGGFWLASRIVRPIAAMSAAAAAINGADLSTRIDTTNVDVELAGLASVLNEMFDRLEAAFERQQQFTADASHELRTPLAILRTNAELALSQARSAEEYRQTIEASLRAANRMSSLVQGLLTLARADAGNPGMPAHAVALDEVVADCLALFKPLAAAKEITLTADIAPARVSGDPDSLAQLVDNLLNNAIQHNHPGGEVHVRLTASDDAILLSVADTGLGIPAQDRPRIFERFFRADKARDRASGGTGLGLAICKTIVESHRGNIDFDSVENQGATFKVRLPRLDESVR